ncbi:MAG: GTP pyrophosphokinase, partial [Magnetococcales bacterium]|nr:GTP pyrophosphokinase [Magnetococcales bacterium]
LADLRQEGFSETILEALDALTHREEDAYDAYVERIASIPLARAVKRLDLEDNMDLRRIENPTEKDFRRMAKYRRVWGVLGNGKHL